MPPEILWKHCGSKRARSVAWSRRARPAFWGRRIVACYRVERPLTVCDELLGLIDFVFAAKRDVA